MDIYELDSYRLSDAVKFHSDLNPRLWDDMKMRPEVREALLRIADDFREFLGIDDLAVEDITVSGSNAAYSYTPHSDIDLHLIVDFSRLNPDQVYQELFNAKKYQYNDQHDIKVRGYDVELYVQDANKPVRSLGEYSIRNDDWTRIPVQRRGNLDEKSTKAKYEKLRDLIELALKSDDLDKIKNITDTIKRYRQAGLDEGGEFGPENLAFKMLRTQGLIKKLWDHRSDLEDARLSLAERKKKKKKSRKRFTYGSFGGWFYPGYHNDSGATGDAGGDGGGGGESVQEQQESQSDIIDRFTKSCCDFLGMEQPPRIRLRRDPQWSQVNGTFGRYDPDSHTVELATAGRHLVDILRTLAHEMTHARQNEIVDLPDDAGETGSAFEDSANAMAGRIMRHWADQEPEMFAGHRLEEQLDRPTPSAQEIMRKHSIDEKTFIDQLKKGIQVELEHTKDVKVAMEIAMDHLNERPDYYDMLASVERPMGEGLGKTLGTAALAGAMALGQAPAKAQSPASTAYNIGRVIYNAPQIFSRAGAEEELKGIVRDMARGQSPSVGGRQIFGRGQQLTRVVGTAGGSSIEQAYEQALAAAISNAQQRHGSIEMSKDQWRVTEHQVQRSGDGYQAAVVISGPVNVRENASGYIPTKKQAKDPRFKTALTVDIKPGQLGKEANKLGLQTDSQGRPDLLMKNLANLLESVKAGEDEDLLEVKMSPAEFQKFLKSPEAEGIRAGFEAELIFRNTQSDPDGGESEPDYEADERAYGIQDIVDFFQGGDNPIGRRAADRLSQELTEQFYDWAREQFANDYFDQDRFMSWAEENVWPDNEDEYRERARDALDDEEISDEELEKQAVQLFRDDVERDWDRSGAWYEMASEELFDEYMGDLDEASWLDQQGLDFMSNVAEEYGLDWPYWTDGSGSGGERDWNEISNSLATVTGMPVRVSGGYHGAARREGQYIVEPDSSLDSDDSDDYGLEIVSPPMPLPEAIEQLQRVIDWANGPGDAYTNSSTGLHMGVSLPFKGGDVDPIKLILFMGDKNLLETFGRESNTYARSAYERLESKIRGMRNAGPKQIEGVLDLMKNNLIELADREMKRGVLGDKYVSVNPHDGYIEFRGPGGDYLAKDSEIDGVLENTMLRLAYAMSIAGDNAAYRKEYAKKLYKVLTKDDPANPFMQLFADYSAGTLTGEQLKRQWADTVLQAERGDVEDVPNAVPGEYEVYDKDSGTPGDRDSFTVIDTFRADDDGEAMARAQENWSGKGVNFGVRAKVAEPEDPKPKSRRAELAKRVTRSTRDVGEQLWRVNHHSSIQYVTARSQAEAVDKAVKKDRAFNSVETRARIATDMEKAQWNLDQERQRERDAGRDAAEIRARLGEPRPAGGGERTYRVTWTERRSDGERQDSLNVRARGPQNAMQRIRDALDAQGREVVRIQADEVTAPSRDGEPIPGSTLDLQRRRAQQAQGEWTGHWIVRDSQGRELTRFHGIGNVQSDANRHAAAWLGRNRPDLVGQEIDVVPEMR